MLILTNWREIDFTVKQHGVEREGDKENWGESFTELDQGMR